MVNISNPFVNRTSIIPIYTPIIKDIPITTTVSLIVSFLLGQVTFFSSSRISLVKAGAGKVFLSTVVSIQYTIIMLKQIIFFLLLYTLYFILYTNSYALQLQSPRFKIEVDRLDIDVKKEKDLYTLENIYDKKSFEQFQSNGYLLKTFGKDKELIFSLSQSILTFPGGEKTISVSGPQNADYFINLIQEYPVKSMSGQTLDLYYSASDQDNFRPLPDQNENNQPALILSGFYNKTHAKIAFRLNPVSTQLEGTYETIVDFIATAGY